MTDLPIPLTTPDIDVRTIDGFILNTERLLASELWALATGEEFKAAMGLWCRCWKQIPAGSLPDDARILASFAGVPTSRWAKVRAVAMRGFVLCSDGRWYHPLMCEDARRAFGRKQAFGDKASKAAKARWQREHDPDALPAGCSEHASSMPQALPGDAQYSTIKQDRGGEPPAAAAAGVAPPSAAGATAPSKRDAVGPGGPPLRAAAAASKKPIDARKLNGDANREMRAMLGKLGLPANAQAANEWEGFFRTYEITKRDQVRSLLAFIVAHDDAQYARHVSPATVAAWSGEQA